MYTAFAQVAPSGEAGRTLRSGKQMQYIELLMLISPYFSTVMCKRLISVHIQIDHYLVDLSTISRDYCMIFVPISV